MKATSFSALSFLFYLTHVSQAFISRDVLNSSSLLMVVELCRHGDRTPLWSFPNDPYPLENWIQGAGQLTEIGMQAHFVLGRLLRKKYIDSGFLSSTYQYTEVYARSTDYERTILSAEYQMMGLFSEKSTLDVSDFPFTPQIVPIHTEAKKNDQVLGGPKSCPQFAYLYSQTVKKRQWQEKQAEKAPLLEKLSIITGIKNFNLSLVELLDDAWFCQEQHGIKQGREVTPQIRQEVAETAKWIWQFETEDKDTALLAGGGILNSLHSYFLAHQEQRNSQENKPPKFVLFSAHDVTIAKFLYLIDAWDGIQPPYNSTVIFELRKESPSNSLVVTMDYNGKRLSIMGCALECPLSHFLHITASVSTSESERRHICHVRSPILTVLLLIVSLFGFILVFGVTAKLISRLGRSKSTVGEEERPFLS